jgi:hypothetical protein
MVCPTRGALFSGTSGTRKGKLMKGKEKNNLSSALPKKQDKEGRTEREDDE